MDFPATSPYQISDSFILSDTKLQKSSSASSTMSLDEPISEPFIRQKKLKKNQKRKMIETKTIIETPKKRGITLFLMINLNVLVKFVQNSTPLPRRTKRASVIPENTRWDLLITNFKSWLMNDEIRTTVFKKISKSCVDSYISNIRQFISWILQHTPKFTMKPKNIILLFKSNLPGKYISWMREQRENPFQAVTIGNSLTYLLEFIRYFKDTVLLMKDSKRSSSKSSDDEGLNDFFEQYSQNSTDSFHEDIIDCMKQKVKNEFLERLLKNVKIEKFEKMLSDTEGELIHRRPAISSEARIQSKIRNNEDSYRAQGRWMDFKEILELETKIKQEVNDWYLETFNQSRFSRTSCEKEDGIRYRNWLYLHLCITLPPLRKQNYDLLILYQRSVGGENMPAAIVFETDSVSLQYKKFKTSQYIGPVWKKIPTESQIYCRRLLKIKEWLNPESQYFIFGSKKDKPHDMGKLFQNIMEEFAHKSITLSILRKIVEITNHKSTLSESEKNFVSTSLLHSVDTAKRVYQLPSSEYVTNQQQTAYNSLISTVTRTPRKYFCDEHGIGFDDVWKYNRHMNSQGHQHNKESPTKFNQ